MITKLSFLFVFILLIINTLMAQPIPKKLPVWEKGFLDIHHISTGRGNASFCIFPDGTTLLIDAGDMSETHARTISARNCAKKPDNSKTTHEWIVDYIFKMNPLCKENGIDYALITHYHDDHFGELDSNRLKSTKGYFLTGITAVGNIIKINKLIDRGFETPNNFLNETFRKKYINDEYQLVQTIDNYRDFIGVMKVSGMEHETFKVGSSTQIKLLRDQHNFKTFTVRNLFANGQIWNGFGSSAFQAIDLNNYPEENPLSCGIRITYGFFNYYTGGDISGINRLGMADENSMEAQAAPIVGQVDVATLNHHGNRDSQSPVWVRNLRPTAWIQQNWSADHPGEEVLNRITSTSLYPGIRDIYATCMLEANKLVIGNAIDKNYISTSGHIVIRVYQEGEKYEIFVLDDNTPNLNVKSLKAYKIKK